MREREAGPDDRHSLSVPDVLGALRQKKTIVIKSQEEVTLYSETTFAHETPPSPQPKTDIAACPQFIGSVTTSVAHSIINDHRGVLSEAVCAKLHPRHQASSMV
ncbi:hypothetical protein E4U55_008106 [Claviceps digitariae]|nr:hypothetical protein E4U55_008106 [Claviceps digitariae]